MKIALGAALSIACALPMTATEHLKSVDKANFDTTYSPKDDFYEYATRGWQLAHPLTDEYARYGQFNVLNDSSEIRVKDLVLGLAATNPAPGSVAHKVSTIYSQAMDMDRRNALGAKPIAERIKMIETTSPEGMEDLFIWMHKNIASPFVSAGPMEDVNDANRYAMYVSGPGMGMGDRDYYLLNDKHNKKVRDAYKKLIVTQLRNAGLSKKDAERVMKNVIKIETALADSAWTKERSRDIVSQNNPRSMAQLKALHPNIPWDRLFIETMDIQTPDSVIITQFEPLAQGAALYSSTSDREKKDLYLWKLVGNASSSLSQPFVDANFEYSKVLSGAKELRPLWKRALSATEGAMGEAIGQLYVEKYFPESSKQYMLGLVENLRKALGKHILHLDWMSDETKLNALNKLNSFTVKIGYPDKWKDYTTMQVDPALSYYDNMQNVGLWHSKEYYSKWGKPVDKTEWGMTPQTVNAYYNPLANEIVFPAAILQAPFFDPEASDAENYGGIGVVIGHEMTHGFDDQGRNFDAKGNISQWWTAEDATKFQEKAGKLIEQFSEVEILPGLKGNGAYTLGENIADQGGLNVAMTAFLDSQKKKGVDINAPEAMIDGLTPIQAFYLNYANLWAQNIRDEEMRNLTQRDVHSLGKQRVNVSLRNLAPFFEAFGIVEGDPMFRPEAERVIIW